MNKLLLVFAAVSLLTSCTKGLKFYNVEFMDGRIRYATLHNDTDISVGENVISFKKDTVISFSTVNGTVESGFLKEHQLIKVNNKSIVITPIKGRYIRGEFDISFYDNGSPNLFFLNEDTIFVCNGIEITFSRPITKKTVFAEGNGTVNGFRECLFLWRNGNPQCGFLAEALKYNNILIPKGSLIRLNKQGNIISYSLDDEEDIYINAD